METKVLFKDDAGVCTASSSGVVARARWCSSSSSGAGTSNTTTTTSTTDDHAASRRPMHVVVLVHGLLGSEHDLAQVEREVFAVARRIQPAPDVVVVRTRLGSTLDGLESGARRALAALHRALEALGVRSKQAHAKLHVRLSIVGHSLGGIYARWLARLIREDDSLALHPHAFVTLATPHLGARVPTSSLVNVLRHVSVPRVSRSTRELSLYPGPDETQTLLLRMATQPAFLEALREFPRRILYANVSADIQVPYRTSALATFNAYARGVMETTRDARFPSLTKWSVENPVRTWEDHPSRVASAFSSDATHAPMMRDMLVGLRSVGAWENYDAVFSTFFAHEQIIGKRAALGFAGRDVAVHVATRVFGPPTSELPVTASKPESLLASNKHWDTRMWTTRFLVATCSLGVVGLVAARSSTSLWSLAQTQRGQGQGQGGGASRTQAALVAAAGAVLVGELLVSVVWHSQML